MFHYFETFWILLRSLEEIDPPPYWIFLECFEFQKEMSILIFYQDLTFAPFCGPPTGVRMILRAPYGSKEESSYWPCFKNSFKRKKKRFSRQKSHFWQIKFFKNLLIYIWFVKQLSHNCILICWSQFGFLIYMLANSFQIKLPLRKSNTNIWYHHLPKKITKYCIHKIIGIIILKWNGSA